MGKKPVRNRPWHRPGVQYALAFLAGIMMFFVSSFAGLLIPWIRIFSGTTGWALSVAPQIVNIVYGTIDTIPVALVFGLGFWLFHRSLRAAGFKGVAPKAAWLGAATAAVLLLAFVITLNSTEFAYNQDSATIQLLVDVAGIGVVGLFYVAGWWLASRQSRVK